MKIAYVVPFYMPVVDGPGQVAAELAERFVKNGHDIHLFTCDFDKQKRIKQKEEIINGVHVHRLYHLFRFASFGVFWPSLIWRLYKLDFDIVHSHVSAHPHTFITSIIAKLKNKPHIHTTHCPWTEAFRPNFELFILKLMYQTLVRISFKFADKIIAITPWEIDFIKKYGGDVDKIEVIPNGMDSILFKKIKNNSFRKEIGIPEKKKLVLFFGRLNPTKAPDILAKAALEILKERKDIFFLYIGPDEGMRKKVKEIVKGNKDILVYEQSIRKKDKIAAMFQASDVYVLPSYREGLPLTIFEAMACGLPVVTTPVNGIPYEFENNVNGFLVKPGNVNELKDKILEVLDNKKLAEKFSKNNFNKAKNYDWNIIADKTLRFYLDLLEKRKSI